MKIPYQHIIEVSGGLFLLFAAAYFAAPLVRGDVVQVNLNALTKTVEQEVVDPLAPQIVCGNGKADPEEYCDDGNTVMNDGCTACRIDAGYECRGLPSACSMAVPEDCGNGTIEGMEMCDDANAASDDGCSAQCEIEPGAECRGSPSMCVVSSSSPASSSTSSSDASSSSSTESSASSALSSSSAASSKGSSSSAAASSSTAASKAASVAPAIPNRGQKIFQHRDSEEEELRAATARTFSSVALERAHCGDGLVLDAEKCDDGDKESGDGCSASCTVEKGYLCYGVPSKCQIFCGDGVIASTETCDDGNGMGGDGCSAACRLEYGYACKGEPSTCTILTPAN